MNFIFACRNLYFKEIRPLSEDKISDPDFQEIYKIAMDYFNNNRTKDFMGLLQEPNYFVQLWVAHLVLEFGNPSTAERTICVEEIFKYSNNPLSPEVSKQEKNWLCENGFINER